MSEVIKTIVANDLCIGCGVCTVVCPNLALSMVWNEYGLLVPKSNSACDNKRKCIEVCPFNPNPDELVKTEKELSVIFNKNNNIIEDETIGKYISIHAGFSNKFRPTSSSGGIATWVLSKLLDKKIVDSVFVVGENDNNSNLFCYSRITDSEKLINYSQTKYYPVTLSEILSKIKETKEKVAIVGIPCFLKAVRLLQYRDSEFNKSIIFTIGLFCGGLKSRFFTEYLSSKIGIGKDNIFKPLYRIKDEKSYASDYSFGAYNKATGGFRKIKMKKVGDMWGTGLFKPHACEYCDDLCSELADISIGDAWIDPYNKDCAGTNIIICRTDITNKLLINGMKSGEVQICTLSREKALLSQQGNYYHRHKGLSYRLFIAKIKSRIIPPKRIKSKILLNPTFELVLNQRTKIRKFSFEYWMVSEDHKKFDQLMKGILMKLKFLTLVNHLTRKEYISRYFKRCFKS